MHTSPAAPGRPAPSLSLAPPVPEPQAGSRADRLAALVARQGGVVTRGQAVGVGYAGWEVDRLVARRRWWPLHPRVYLVDRDAPTDEARVRAAALWAGDGAVVVGAAALWWHAPGGRAPRRVAVAVPRRCPATRAGLVVRRRSLRSADVVRVRGLAVAVRPLALLDAAVDAGPAGAALLDRALRDPARGPGVVPAQLRAVVGRAAGSATALRLVTGLGRGVTSAAGAAPAGMDR